MSFKDVTTNKNFLSPLGFKFVLTRLPNVEYFCQSVRLPEVSLDVAISPNPFQPIKLPGTKLSFGSLRVTFKVDEDLKNYLEIFNWMDALAITDSFDGYRELATQPIVSDRKPLSDGSLVILTSSKNPRHQATFIDMFPVSLSSLDFNSTLSDVDYIEATVEFEYRRFVLTLI